MAHRPPKLIVVLGVVSALAKRSLVEVRAVPSARLPPPRSFAFHTARTTQRLGSSRAERSTIGPAQLLAENGVAYPSATELSPEIIARRSTLLLLATPTVAAAAGDAPKLKFTADKATGIQWADVKPGSGAPYSLGQRVAIDYVMSTTGARYGSKIDSTVDRQTPYVWTLGDGSTIRGLEIGILGSGDVPAMLPGGLRRLIIPSNAQTNLAYADLAKVRKDSLQWQDCGGGPGPVPPETPQKSADMGAGEFQRFKNIYCNANRPYQPDVVLDVKLFSKSHGS